MIPWGTHLIPNTWQLIWTNWLLLVTDLPQQMLKEEQEVVALVLVTFGF